MRRGDGLGPRVRADVELELEPLAASEAVGLVAVLASLCVVSCGAVMFYGSDWSRTYDSIGWVGLVLIVGGGGACCLITWLLQPHRAVRHASHRLRFHARRRRDRSHADVDHPAQMSDAQFDELEDEVDHALADEPGDR